MFCLPTELQDAVCDHLAPSHLAALSRSCSQFYAVAQRHLYRHVHITPAFHNLSVVLTLATKPHIARHVRSFSLSLASQSSVFQAYYRHLASALSHMTELSFLHLFVDPSASWVLQRSRATHLLTFACSFPFDSHVSAFLATAPGLLELEVGPSSSPSSHNDDGGAHHHQHHSPTSIDVSPSLIPHLEQFRGSSHIASSLVPNRPVHTVHLTSGDLTDQIVSRLAESSNRVSILGATISSLPAPLLQLLSERLPDLMYLRITTTYNFSDAPDVTFYRNVSNALGALTQLQAFELSGMHWGSLKNNENEMRVWQSKPFNSEQIHQHHHHLGFEEEGSEQQQQLVLDDDSFDNNTVNNALDVDIYSELFVDY
ncbi:hypothetical protein K435DRAFT_775003 [Dendrothele bispora CBS 962.96]|uniref:F-box domain-containing protein n=1 Tax=Dendrothele bispora (strain CBS 962.96) TaxID=1314807 RepID=A0A4S8MLD1_DENBC|nr:hypothetical protein K435DRAFT_775003 [Dendrothele bispora CBS 962.96]